MSRRKAFDTGLTSTSKSKSDSAPAQSAPPTRVQRAPSISSPEHAHAHTSEKVIPPPDDDSEPDDSGTCFICAEPIQFWSLGVCGHRTCHVCAIRLRVFYKKKECTFCKTPTPSLLFSRSPKTPFPTDHHLPSSDPHLIASRQGDAEKIEKEGKKWEDGLILPGTLDLAAFPHTDDKLGVAFEDEDMMETTLLLLRFNCPFPDCPHMASDWNSLEKHTLATHGLVLCGLCRRQLSRFAHEQVLYPPHLLPLHDPSQVKRGQRPPRPRGDKEMEMVKGWEAPHPMCEFCHQAFFGPDELFKHMRGSHEECFVCKQLGERDVYFQNYGKLEHHFNTDHYPCPQPSCLEKKFIVFPTDMDLRAHMVTEHGEEMSARDRANARHVQVDFQQPPSSRGGRAHSRGFTMQQSSIPNGHSSRMRDAAPQGQQITQPPPMSGAQAAQHRRQVQTDRAEETSRRRRNFDTGLSSAREVREEESGGSGWNTPREDVDDATAMRHQELRERMEILTAGNENKMASFRSSVRQYKHGESNAKDLVDTLYNVLDQDTDATTGVVREIANLFESEGEKDKVTSLLAGLNAFRIEQREQFPSLASAPAGLGTNYAGITSGAILNAKRSTQTHRTGGTTVWDRVEAAAASPPGRAPTNTGGRYVPGAGVPASASAFPALAGTGAGKVSTHSTPWSTGGAGSSSKTPPALTGPIITSVNFPVPKTKSAPLNKSAFPSLPTANKATAEERKALFSKGSAREESIKRVMGIGSAPPPVSSWGGGAAGALNGISDVTSGVDSLEVDDPPIIGGSAGGANVGGGKKKGKQKQQLLFSVSARP